MKNDPRRLSADDELALVRSVLDAAAQPARARKARAVLLAAARWPLGAISDELGVPPGAIRSWLDEFRRERVARARPHRVRDAVAAVVKLVQGERIDAVARERGISTAVLARWRDAFFAGGYSFLERRAELAEDDGNTTD